MHGMQKLLEFIEKTYGSRGFWTIKQLITDAPQELLPETTRMALAGGVQGGGTSLARLLVQTGKVEKVARMRTGAALWRLK